MSTPACDARLVDTLQRYCVAFTSASTAEEKQGARDRLSDFFQGRIHISTQSSNTVLAPIQKLDLPDENKIRIYAIAARALIKKACPSVDFGKIDEAIQNRLEGYSRPSSQLAQELNAIYTGLSLLPAAQRTPINISFAMHFFKNLEGMYLVNILKELPEFAEDQRLDYFLHRRTKCVVGAVNLFKTNKCTALKTLIPTIKAFNGDEARISIYISALKLIPQPELLQSLPILSDILKKIPTNTLANDFLKTLANDVNEDKRLSFLRHFVALIDEIGIQRAVKALQEIGPYIGWRGSTPITHVRVQLWQGLVDALKQGSTLEEDNRVKAVLSKISDTKIDEFCRRATPICAEIPSVFNRLVLVSFFAMSLPFHEEMPQELQLLSAFLPQGANYQIYGLLPSLGELLKNSLSNESAENLISTIQVFLTLYKPEQIANILKTAARLYKDIKVDPNVLISAIALLPSELYHSCTSENARLQAHLAILNGVEGDWVIQLSDWISKLQADAVISAAPLCSKVNSGGLRANLLSILFHIPIRQHVQAAEKYFEFLKSAHIKDGSNSKSTAEFYNTHLKRVPLLERLDAIEHFAIVFDDDQLRSMSDCITESTLQNLGMISDSLASLYLWSKVITEIPSDHLGAVFRWTALICRNPIREKVKVLEKMSKLPPTLLKPIAEQIHSQFSALNTGTAIAAKITELAQTMR